MASNYVDDGLQNRNQIQEGIEGGPLIGVRFTKQPTRSSRSRQGSGIVHPRDDRHRQTALEDFLQLVKWVKSGGKNVDHAPSGVLLLGDQNIRLSKDGHYEEDREYMLVKTNIGRGSSSATIKVARDKIINTLHAIKIIDVHSYTVKEVDLNEFNENELRCWVDLNESLVVPVLYLFQIEKTNILLHMELIDNAITFKCLISYYRDRIIIYEPQLCKPLSILLLKKLLYCLFQLHTNDWSHNDLHGGNVMIKVENGYSIRMILLDCGSAERLSVKPEKFKKDIDEAIELLELFIGLAICYKPTSLQHKLLKAAYSVDDLKELAHLVNKLKALSQPSEVEQFIMEVDELLQDYGRMEIERRFSRHILKYPDNVTSPYNNHGDSLELPMPTLQSREEDQEDELNLPSPPSSPDDQPKFLHSESTQEDLDAMDVTSAISDMTIKEVGATELLDDDQETGSETTLQASSTD